MKILIQAFPRTIEDVKHYYDYIRLINSALQDYELHNNYELDYCALYIHGVEDENHTELTEEDVISLMNKEMIKTGFRTVACEFSAKDNSNDINYLKEEGIIMFRDEEGFETEKVVLFNGTTMVETIYIEQKE